MTRDLSILTVVDLSGTPAPSFAGSLLADFGAVVIVVEPPGGSPLRRLGSSAVRDVWWPIASRNKSSLALDPAVEGASEILVRLAERADIVLRDADVPFWPSASAAGAVDVLLHAPGRTAPICGATRRTSVSRRRRAARWR